MNAISPRQPLLEGRGAGSPAMGLGAMGRRLAVAGLLAGLGGVFLAVDVPVATWCRTHRLPGDLARLIDLGEVFAHGLAVAVLLVVTVSLDPGLRRAGRGELLRLVAAAYSGGLVVDLVKAVVTRVRPRAADLTSVASVFDTFGTAAAAEVSRGGGLIGKSADLMSFPSGHAAVAGGLATALAWKYPHAAPTFAVLAAVAAAQRVVSSAHYPSDVAFGAAIGVGVAAVCLGRAPPGLRPD